MEDSEVLSLPFDALYSYYLAQGGKDTNEFKDVKMGLNIKLHITHFLREFATGRFILKEKSDRVYDRVTKSYFSREALSDEQEDRKILILNYLLREEEQISKSYDVQ